jgi:UDPglucose 6-dehydrogenase
MKIAVIGLWHLGTVTAASLAAEGHDVVAIDAPAIVEGIRHGRFPVDEPGLAALTQERQQAGRLRFGSTPADADGAELLWFTYDTPVDDEDRADVGFVTAAIDAFLHDFPGSAVVAISSQLPVGTVAGVMQRAGERFSFAAIPENLRLGSAISYFRAPDRFIVGTTSERARTCLADVFAPFAPNIVWMSVESAEMTKHAINAFLATSVVFANELAEICERVGADAREVERGLKSDIRVGPKAYVRAGEAFAGGTLARDLGFLAQLGDRFGTNLAQIRATPASNAAHRTWVRDRVFALVAGRTAARVAMLGVVYKPGTNTLRSSSAVATARSLVDAGMNVSGYDPAIDANDERLTGLITMHASAAAALDGADVVVIGTAWPEFRELPLDAFDAVPLGIVDEARFLEERFGQRVSRYVAFGRPVAEHIRS